MLRRLPDTLPSRVLLVVLIGITVTVTAAWGLLLLDRQRTEARMERFHQARMVADAADLLSMAPPEQRALLLNALDRRGMRVTLGHPPRAGLTPDDSRLAKALRERLPGSNPQVFTRPSPRGHGRQQVVMLDPIGGPVMTAILRSPTPPTPDSLPWLWLLPLMGVGIATLVIVRLAIRPLRELVVAARRFDGSTHLAPLPEAGPREIREALAAFNRMQERIDAHLRERTEALAAISHDLKTPLTRLRLRAERIDDAELAAAVVRDIDRMRDLIETGLELARASHGEPDTEPLSLGSVLAESVETARELGGDVTLEVNHDCIVAGDFAALSRLFDNLLDNARRYARSARVTVDREDGQARVAIDDQGPGLPADGIQRAFDPFFRGEPSRSQTTGGTGLGLTIARKIARQHGGDIRLENHHHGLRVTVHLPLAPYRDVRSGPGGDGLSDTSRR